MTLYPNLILDALRNVRYPASGKDIVSAGMVEDDIRIDGMKVSFSLIFDRPTDPFIKSLVKAAETAILTYISPEVDIRGNIAVKTRIAAPAPVEKPLAEVKNIIGISSGKGGVGKSTVAANLAVALAREGYKVGLLDADIFGPSVPKMFDVEDAELYMRKEGDRSLIIPLEKYGVKLLSIGFLVDRISSSTCPPAPATSISHLCRLSASQVWSSSQHLRRWRWPMPAKVSTCFSATKSMYRCSASWRTWHGSPPRSIHRSGVRMLAQIPLVAKVCEDADKGHPIALRDSVMGHEFLHLAHEVADAVEERNATLPATEKVDIKHK